MIRKIAAALALVVMPVLALAQTDSASTLTPSGKLYTIESVFAQGIEGLKTSANYVLSMTVHEGESQTQSFVPASLLAGTHTSPAVAYDSDTQTLFVFWERGRNGRLSSDLVFCSYRDGNWTEPVIIESGDFERSSGLRIGVTKKIEVAKEDGSIALQNELTVHASWWNDSGYKESARYAMLTIEDGTVSNIAIHELTDFLLREAATEELTKEAIELNPQIRRQPIMLETPGRAAVDVIFAEMASEKLQKVTIKPVLQISEHGRLRVPVGAKGGNVGAPNFRTEVNGKIGGVESGEKLGLYVKTKESLLYSTFENGEWSEVRALPIGRKLTHEAAVEAVRRLVEE